jgi:hypothetical protein
VQANTLLRGGGFLETVKGWKQRDPLKKLTDRSSSLNEWGQLFECNRGQKETKNDQIDSSHGIIRLAE